jgi:hypothetical protein
MPSACTSLEFDQDVNVDEAHIFPKIRRVAQTLPFMSAPRAGPK